MNFWLVGVFCRKICCLLFVGNLGSKIICQIKWRFHWDWSCLPNLVYPTSTFTFYPTLRIMDFKWFQYTKSQRSGNWNWIHVYIYTKSPNLKDQYIPNLNIPMWLGDLIGFWPCSPVNNLSFRLIGIQRDDGWLRASVHPRISRSQKKLMYVVKRHGFMMFTI